MGISHRMIDSARSHFDQRHLSSQITKNNIAYGALCRLYVIAAGSISFRLYWRRRAREKIFFFIKRQKIAARRKQMRSSRVSTAGQ